MSIKDEFEEILDALIAYEGRDIIPVLGTMPSRKWREIFHHVPGVRHDMLEHARQRLEHHKAMALLAEQSNSPN